MFPTVYSSTQGFGVEQNPASYDYGSLLLIFTFIILIPIVIFTVYVLYQTGRKRKSLSHEWEEVNVLFKKRGLTREESFLIKQSLKQFHLKHPTDIMNEKEVYDIVMKKTHQRAGTHTEHLIQSTRQKLFG